MAIRLGSESLAHLKGVHPDIVRVVTRAALMATADLDFKVIEGVRTDQQCYINYGKGRTAAQCAAKGVPAVHAAPGLPKVTWLSDPLNSKHRKQKDGFGHAVDLIPYPVDWNNLKRFDALAKLVLEAAKLEKVSLRWGADWNQNGRPREKGETDSPHFELA
jgi:peptidoglycan L-alanyl-D-glutamate endopeptidase CwlK